MILGGGGQPWPFVYKKWIFDNCGVIVTLIIHWLRPPYFYCTVSEATLLILRLGLDNFRVSMFCMQIARRLKGQCAECSGLVLACTARYPLIQWS